MLLVSWWLSTEFTVSNSDWHSALNLASDFGWEGEPEGGRFTLEAARSLADALEESLERLPEEEDWAERYLYVDCYPYNVFSGSERKQVLRDLIAFIRKSRGFDIGSDF